MYSIGDFSRITGITAKALRHYHEIDLLIPDKIDEINNYRFYSENQIETAIMIAELKEVDFSLKQIREIIERIKEGKDLKKFLDTQKEKLSKEIENYTAKIKRLGKIVNEKKGAAMNNIDLTVQEKDIPDILIAYIRYQGRYKEIGPLFGKLGRACNVNICGPALALYYDNEYKEEGATFEAAMPIKAKIDKEGIKVRELKGGRAITLIHKGPYENIGTSYKKIIDYMSNKKIKPTIPSREVYLKGPGFIFKNPKKYITEIQFLI